MKINNKEVFLGYTTWLYKYKKDKYLLVLSNEQQDRLQNGVTFSSHFSFFLYASHVMSQTDDTRQFSTAQTRQA